MIHCLWSCNSMPCVLLLAVQAELVVKQGMPDTSGLEKQAAVS